MAVKTFVTKAIYESYRPDIKDKRTINDDISEFDTHIYLHLDAESMKDLFDSLKITVRIWDVSDNPYDVDVDLSYPDADVELMNLPSKIEYINIEGHLKAGACYGYYTNFLRIYDDSGNERNFDLDIYVDYFMDNPEQGLSLSGKVGDILTGSIKVGKQKHAPDHGDFSGYVKVVSREGDIQSLEYAKLKVIQSPSGTTNEIDLLNQDSISLTWVKSDDNVEFKYEAKFKASGTATIRVEIGVIFT